MEDFGGPGMGVAKVFIVQKLQQLGLATESGVAGFGHERLPARHSLMTSPGRKKS